MFKLFARFASPRPVDPATQALRALDRGLFDEADRMLSALLQNADLAPAERAFLVNKRGVARVYAGRSLEAEADFECALELLPRYAPALTNLGNLHLERGALAEAVQRYEAAVASDGEYATAHLNLGVAYRRLGRIADSVRSLRKAHRLEGRFNGKPSRRP